MPSRGIVFIVLLILGVSLTTSAQQRAAPNPLPSVRSLKCSFTTAAFPSWAGGEPQVQVKTNELLTFTIADIDLDEGTATIIGTGGTFAVTVKMSGSNLHVLDLRATGAAMLTTVFSQVSKDGRLKAVHTQTEPAVAQYSGDCEILKSGR